MVAHSSTPCVEQPSATVWKFTSPSGDSLSPAPTLQQLPEKDKIACQTETCISSLDDPVGHARPCSKVQRWAPSLLRIGPLAGLVALLFSFLQIFASYAILVVSNGRLMSEWTYQPSVYLAVLTSISNKALAFAVIQGAIITFWRKALRGTTLLQLSKNFGFGIHMYKALTAGRSFNVLAFACIAATVVIIDGPLLQRASTIQPGFPMNRYDINVRITPELPGYFTGAVDFEYEPETTVLDFQPHWMGTYYDWAAEEPIHGLVTGCPRGQTCRAVIRGPALAVDHCTSSVKHHNFNGNISNEIKDPPSFVEAQPSWTVFKEHFNLLNGSVETLVYETVVSDDDVGRTCIGNVTTTKCYLVSAIGEYTIDSHDGTITFPESIAYPKILKRANNTALTDESIEELHLTYPLIRNSVRSTFAGIANAAMIAFYNDVALVPTKAGGPYMYPSPNQYVFQHITNYATRNDFVNYCAPAWKDPRDQVMAKLNELLFRTGLYAAQTYPTSYLETRLDPGLQLNSTVDASLVGPVSVFHSDMAYFAGAATAELVAILAILVTLYGWWELGRPVSFSPLEIAKAFGSPLLAEVPANSSARDIERTAGAREVQYGSVLRSPGDPASSEEQSLAFGEKTGVVTPATPQRTFYQQWQELSSVGSLRITRSRSEA